MDRPRRRREHLLWSVAVVVATACEPVDPAPSYSGVYELESVAVSSDEPGFLAPYLSSIRMPERIEVLQGPFEQSDGVERYPMYIYVDNYRAGLPGVLFSGWADWRGWYEASFRGEGFAPSRVGRECVAQRTADLVASFEPPVEELAGVYRSGRSCAPVLDEQACSVARSRLTPGAAPNGWNGRDIRIVVRFSVEEHELPTELCAGAEPIAGGLRAVYRRTEIVDTGPLNVSAEERADGGGPYASFRSDDLRIGFPRVIGEIVNIAQSPL